MKLNILYEDEDVLIIDKPAGLTVFPEGKSSEKTLIDYLLERFFYLREAGQTPRYGIVHRLDKNTSGILVVAKNNKALVFFQDQFKTGKVIKKYLALVVGSLKTDEGEIETLIGRSKKDRRKQKVYLATEPQSKGKRKATTKHRTLEKFENYTLIEVSPETGRKHQVRTHLAYLGHPIAGDKLYGFKKQACPKELSRQFLHAHYLKIKLPGGKVKEFYSELPSELKNVLENLTAQKK